MCPLLWRTGWSRACAAPTAISGPSNAPGPLGVRTEIASLETRLIRWLVGTVIATATLTVGILRVIG